MSFTSFLFVPFKFLFELISRKGMVFLRFKTYFHILNGYENLKSHSPWSYLSNELSYSKKYQGVRKLHLSQGNYIYGINNTFLKVISNIRHLGTLSKKLI